MRLTLRTLLAYLDDNLSASEAREIGLKVAENQQARELIDRIKRVTRKRSLATPPTTGDGILSDSNTVASYLSDTLESDALAKFEKTCLESDVHLAEVAASHQILTLVLTEQIRISPSARQRMYKLVKGRESIPGRIGGQTIPAVGSLAEIPTNEHDDLDQNLLLGFPSFHQPEPSQTPWPRILLCGLLLTGLIVLGWYSWPAVHESSTTSSEKILALAPPTPVVTSRDKPAADARSSTKPEKKPADSSSEKPEIPEKKSPASSNDAVTTPIPEIIPPPQKNSQPSTEKLTIPEPPQPDRLPIGKLEKAGEILLRKPESTDWARVQIGDGNIFTSEKLVALPGFKSSIRFNSGVKVDLWGNVNELLPAPLMHVALTPYLPADSYHADIKLEAGRIYLSTSGPMGAKIRLRSETKQWEITLPDNKSEMVVEFVPLPKPSPPAVVRALFAVTQGKCTILEIGGEVTELSKGGELFWDGVTKKSESRQVTSPAERASQTSYLSKFVVSPNAARAKTALEVIDSFTKKINETGQIRAILDEAIQLDLSQPTTPFTIVAARLAVLSFAALGDVSKIADSLTNQSNPVSRAAACEGIRSILASDPTLIPALRTSLIDERRLGEEQANNIIRLAIGLSAEQRTDPKAVDALFQDMLNGSLPIRELAYQNLLSMLSPEDQKDERLFMFDAASDNESQESVLMAWRRKVDEIKKRLDKS